MKISRPLAATLAAVLMAASCGSTDESGVGGAVVAEDGTITLTPSAGATAEVTASALGGIRFEHPIGTEVRTVDDVVLVTPDIERAEIVSAHVKLVSQLSSGSQVESVDQYIEVIGLTYDVTPTDTALVVDGLRLSGYEITGSEPDLIFASSRFPAPVIGIFGPSNHTLSFVTATASGVLDVGVSGATPEEAQAQLPTLGTILASLEFTGPGLDPALPPGELIEPAEAGPPPPPADGEDAADPPLGPAFSPAQPGRYEVLNFGMPISVEVGEGWFIQPNFPGVVVLADPTSIGPNDRDVVLINSIAELVPLAGGPLVAGDPMPVTDIEALLADPPAPLKVDDVERLVLEAGNGATTPVISFTVEVEGDPACSPTEPCELGLVTTYGFVKQLRATDAHRIWWFPEHPHGPAAVIASAGVGSDWMSRADDLMETLALNR